MDSLHNDEEHELVIALSPFEALELRLLEAGRQRAQAEASLFQAQLLAAAERAAAAHGIAEAERAAGLWQIDTEAAALRRKRREG